MFFNAIVTKPRYAINENDENQSYNIITDNLIDGVSTAGIKIAGTGSTAKGNRFYNCVANIIDTGTGTILATVRTNFLKELGPAAWVTTAANPMGIEVDAANEGALAKIKLPTDLQQVIRIKVWAISNITEADAMRLEVAAAAGGDNEAWNAETIAVADKPSTSTNFAVEDVIYWTFTSADDADIGDLGPGDLLQWCIYYETAGGADCETDVLICGYVLEIEYI